MKSRFYNKICVFLSIFISLLSVKVIAQQNDLEYFRSMYSESEVRTYMERAYTNKNVNPFTVAEYDAIRSKTVGDSFYDPGFGRKWTFIYNGGHTIMNSERQAWNSDSSLFFLDVDAEKTYKKLALFDGKTADYIRSETISGLPSWSGGDTRTAFRWMPDNPELLYYIMGNKMYTHNINTHEDLVYQVFASFTMTEYDLAGGDGNDGSPNGDLLFGNKGSNCFVYNIKEKKIVRTQDGSRVYFDASAPFPTFSLGAIDYAIAFEGYVFELDEDGGGVIIRDCNGAQIMELYRRTPHMDPTYYKHEGKLYPGIVVRYNSADAGYYAGKGYPSETNRAYFHGFNPDNPTEFVRFQMDMWPSTTLGSGGQTSYNRFDGSTGIHCTHGPALYDLSWESRYGECYEHAFSDGESTMVRRFAHHYIGFESKYSSSSYQPEGWQSPDGKFAVIKTKWGWYKVDLSSERMTKSEVDEYLNSDPETFFLIVEKGTGDGECVEGAVRTVTADPASYGYEFDKWTGDTEFLSDPNAQLTEVTMPAKHITITANYKEKEKYNLTVNINGNGSVILNPSGGEYYDGTLVALIGTADAGFTFINYSGDFFSSQNPAVLTINSDITVTATFADLVNNTDEFNDNRKHFYVYPNPVANYFRVSFILKKKSEVSMCIYDMNGRMLKNIYNADCSEGNHYIQFQSNDHLPRRGIYFLQLKGSNFIKTQKIVY